ASRYGHTAVWTGTEMLIWGGYDGAGGNTLNNGARYNPSTNVWTPISTTNAPSARGEHSAVWTGDRMIIWGGEDFFAPIDTGASYDPMTNTWTAISMTG